MVGEEDGDEEEVEEEETIEEETDITENDSLGRAIVDKASTVGESSPRTSKRGKVGGKPAFFQKSSCPFMLYLTFALKVIKLFEALLFLKIMQQFYVILKICINFCSLIVWWFIYLYFSI